MIFLVFLSLLKRVCILWYSFIIEPYDSRFASSKPSKKTASEEAVSVNDDGSEFPDVTEQTSFISEVSGGAPSDSSRSTIYTPASTFIGDGLSTSIISPTDSSATTSSDYHSTNKSANLSSKNCTSSTHRDDLAEVATDSAKVFVTPTSITDKVLFVGNIKNKESFDVSILTPSTVDINFNWWIVQTE